MDATMIKLQSQIRQNSQGIQDYMNELNDWTQTAVTKDTKVKKEVAASVKTSEKAKPLPPIRNRVDISNSIKNSQNASEKYQQQKKDGNIFSESDVSGGGANKNEGQKDKSGVGVKMSEQQKRDVTPMPEYYKAWDKFNVDQALGSDEEDQGGKPIIKADPSQKIKYQEPKHEPKTQEEMLKLTSGAKPNTKIVVKGGTVKKQNEAELLKQQGNSYFTSLEYEKAIECYTKCIDVMGNSNDNELRKIVLSNRAQSNLKLKKYSLAEIDATEALLLDSKHIKSLQRRGTARYYQDKIRGAIQDFKQVLLLEDNKLMVEYLNKACQKQERIRFEAYEKMKRRVLFAGIDLEGAEFKNQLSTKVAVKEINLEKQALQDRDEKKGEVVKRQQEKAKESLTDTSDTSNQTKKKSTKDKKKKKKNKGLAAFMEDDNEAKQFEKVQQEEYMDKNNNDENKEQTKKKKKGVLFNMEDNQIKEFDKNSRITEVEVKGDFDSERQQELVQQIQKEKIKNKQSKGQKHRVDVDAISKLNQSKAIEEAQLKLLGVPQSASQFERDYKGFKANAEQKLNYMSRMSSANVISLFKTELDFDIFIDIIKTFSSQDEHYLKENAGFIGDFVLGLLSAKSYEMNMIFLEDQHKKGIPLFIYQM